MLRCIRAVCRACSCRACFTIFFASLWVLCLSGPCFGFNSLYPVLYAEQIFVDACDADVAAVCKAAINTTRGVPCCDEQSKKIVMLSTITLFAEDGVLVLYGELQDRVGARNSLLVAGSIMSTGLGMLAYNSLIADLELLWYAGFFLLGVAGPGIFLSALSLGEKFEGLEPVITPIITAMFDASSLVFLIWSALYAQGTGVSFATILLSWLGLALLSSACVYFLIPSNKALQTLHLQRQENALTRSRELPDSLLDPFCSASSLAGVAHHGAGGGSRRTSRECLDPVREPTTARTTAPTTARASRECRDRVREPIPTIHGHDEQTRVAHHEGGGGEGGGGGGEGGGGEGGGGAIGAIGGGVSTAAAASAAGLVHAEQYHLYSHYRQPADGLPYGLIKDGLIKDGLSRDGQPYGQPLPDGRQPSPDQPGVRMSKLDGARHGARQEGALHSSDGGVNGGASGGANGRCGAPSPQRHPTVAQSLSAPMLNGSSPGRADREHVDREHVDREHLRRRSRDELQADGRLKTTPLLNTTPMLNTTPLLPHVGGGSLLGEMEVLHYDDTTTLRELLCRTDTVLMVSFMASLNLKQAFYIQTVAQQLEVTWDLEISNHISNYFNVLFPVLALLSTPLAVWLFAKFQHRDHEYMVVCGGLMSAWAISQGIPSVATQYAAATLFGPARTLVWAAYFHFFQNAARYPPSKLGRLIGYSNLLLAVVGDLPPIPLYSYAKNQRDDAASTAVFTVIHAVLTGVVLAILIVLVVYLRRQHRRMLERFTIMATGA